MRASWKKNRLERERKEAPGWERSPGGRATSPHHGLSTPAILFAWVSTDMFRMSLSCPPHGVSCRDWCQQLRGRTGMGTASRPCPKSPLFPTPPAIHILHLDIYLSLKRRREWPKVKFLAELIYFQGIFDRCGEHGLWAKAEGSRKAKNSLANLCWVCGHSLQSTKMGIKCEPWDQYTRQLNEPAGNSSPRCREGKGWGHWHQNETLSFEVK